MATTQFQLSNRTNTIKVPHIITPPKSSFGNNSIKVPHIITPPKSSLNEDYSSDESDIDISDDSIKLIDYILNEEEENIFDESDIQNLQYLLNDTSKYRLFSRIFPENTCNDVIIKLNNNNIEVNDKLLVKCINSKSGSIAVNLVTDKNTNMNMIYFDTENEIINRYDPKIPGYESYQDIIDDRLREYLTNLFPDYEYLGNTLEEWQCVSSKFNCQDICLLYTLNRINGMDHEQAAYSLSSDKDIQSSINNLILSLSYRLRSEISKPIPAEYSYLNV